METKSKYSWKSCVLTRMIGIVLGIFPSNWYNCVLTSFFESLNFIIIFFFSSNRQTFWRVFCTMETSWIFLVKSTKMWFDEFFETKKNVVIFSRIFSRQMNKVAFWGFLLKLQVTMSIFHPQTLWNNFSAYSSLCPFSLFWPFCKCPYMGI